jgi:hypothetical protein
MGQRSPNQAVDPGTIEAEAAAEMAIATVAATAMLVGTVALETRGAAMLAVQPEAAQETATAAKGIPMEAALVAAWAVDLAGM